MPTQAKVRRPRRRSAKTQNEVTLTATVETVDADPRARARWVRFLADMLNKYGLDKDTQK